jgi:hypothetical protein
MRPEDGGTGSGHSLVLVRRRQEGGGAAASAAVGLVLVAEERVEVVADGRVLSVVAAGARRAVRLLLDAADQHRTTPYELGHLGGHPFIHFFPFNQLDPAQQQPSPILKGCQP